MHFAWENLQLIQNCGSKTSRKVFNWHNTWLQDCDKVHEPESLSTLWNFTVFTIKVYEYTIKQYTRGGQRDKLQQPHLGGNLERAMYKDGSETTYTVPTNQRKDFTSGNWQYKMKVPVVGYFSTLLPWQDSVRHVCPSQMHRT